MSCPHVSAFQGAVGTSIAGSSIVINNSVEQNDTGRAMDIWLNHCCLEAQLDSDERFNPPRCDEGTRVSTINSITQWISVESVAASVLVYHGPAGCGKSALEQSIAEQCQREGRLGGAFFFSRTSPNARRADGNMVIPTLVYQLAQIFPWLKEKVLKEIKKDPGVFMLSRTSLADRLLAKPFTDATLLSQQAVKRTPLLIALDGLDECNNTDVQCDLLRIIAQLVARLRYPFRFLVATRPESHIMSILKHEAFSGTPNAHIRDITHTFEIHDDIGTFLDNGFRRIRTTHPLHQLLPAAWPSKTIIWTLVEKASGQFIYADTVLKFVESPKHQPEDRLKVVLGLSIPNVNEQPFSQLDALYTHLFSAVAHIEIVWHVLGVIHLEQEEISIGKSSRFNQYHGDASNKWRTLASLQQILPGTIRPGDILLAFDPLASIVTFSPDEECRIRVQHASLFDFLLDVSRSGPYCLDLSLAHGSLTEWYWKQISRSSTAVNGLMNGTGTAIFRFIHHCHFSVLSEIILELIQKVSLFLLGFLDCSNEEWEANRWIGLRYNEILCNLSQLLRREGLSLESVSTDVVEAVATRWRALAVANPKDPIAQVLSQRIMTPNKSVVIAGETLSRNVTNGPQNYVDVFKEWATSLISPLSPSFGRSRKATPDVASLGELADELAGSHDGSVDVQFALAAARLFFWRECMSTAGVHCTLPSSPTSPSSAYFSTRETVKTWVLHALTALSIDDGSGDLSAFDAAILLFITSLLPFCIVQRQRPDDPNLDAMILAKICKKSYGNNSDVPEAVIAVKFANALGFPRLCEHYHEEALAYIERVRAVNPKVLVRDCWRY
ncbi:unnamed protein product [Cyclocybe aegerita]|uniref:Nephrocystin 3-like N-terminal domain-containing protein n=1 Tax=Cyclocybe aegerita TaxID=1973307 RepID=A0A8S0WAD5_CYCAE|nr:unnamed protein product [Cyclocybe aegerita]